MTLPSTKERSSFGMGNIICRHDGYHGMVWQAGYLLIYYIHAPAPFIAGRVKSF
jgi:hypothetical protein